MKKQKNIYLGAAILAAAVCLAFGAKALMDRADRKPAALSEEYVTAPPAATPAETPGKEAPPTETEAPETPAAEAPGETPSEKPSAAPASATAPTGTSARSGKDTGKPAPGGEQGLEEDVFTDDGPEVISTPAAQTEDTPDTDGEKTANTESEAPPEEKPPEETSITEGENFLPEDLFD